MVLLGRSMAPFAKLNPHSVSTLRLSFSAGKLTSRSSIMEQLNIVDLGDAMTETRCSATIGSQFDFTWGPGHWRC